MAEFQPFVPSEKSIPEFSVRAVILGVVFGIIFGASTVYLALRAGLTVSASIPIAVLAIAVFKKLGRSTILENNMVQTIGSAGESIAAGVVFTIPALTFLSGGDAYFKYFQICTLALVGGILGILFMIPLRRALIVKEHATLPYPEGTACADVLIAGEKGGNLAKMVFSGVWVAVIYKILMSIFGLWKDVPAYSMSRTSQFPNATIMSEITPEYLGVGYIIGPLGSARIVAGSILSWMVLIPLVTIFGDQLTLSLLPGWKDMLISQMSPMEIYKGYVRYIGAGAVAAGGLFTLIRTIPTIVHAFREGFKGFKEMGKGVIRSRVESDIPMVWVVVGSLALAFVISVLPQFPGKFPNTLVMSFLIIIFGFFFVTVSSRVVGIIGSSNNPVSGMTIAALMATCLIFVSIGWKGDAYQAIALMVGATVCIAACNAGATSQDLKTGYLVGATPYKQQIGLVIGVLASSFVVALTLFALHTSPYGPIGSERLSAPQATLMATLIKGLLAQELPWGLVLSGFMISSVMELMGVRSLAVAVGIYLPIATTFPIFIGGLMNALVSWATKKKEEEGEVSSGMLYSTGLVAGGCVAGILIAVVAGVANGSIAKALNFGEKLNIIGGLGPMADVVSVAAFAILCILLIKAAVKKTVK
ncbi:MAG: oligopeptide transporter, OPT family [Deltaproteobacteria bacterium CG11_big_fil_rev_8_21_14_0_20_49_13]|nr:MAG: oligopeptide transporter, OPT family [Deltaproteobacteria bacterium CG11_big_fil_rev_8_21_14_0_20_49_13]